MAFKNVLDPSALGDKLAIALDRNLPDVSDVHVTDVQLCQASGMSCETLLFDAHWKEDANTHHEHLVARVQPTGPGLYPRYDLGLEYQVMNTLGARTDIPVPPTYFHETNSDVLGAPFIVMQRARGQAPPDDPPFTTGGWVCELTAEQQATLHDNALTALARIHAVDIDAVALGHLRDHPEAGMARQLAFWRSTFAWAADGDTNPTVEAALDWIADNQPTDTGDPVLSWGDSRPGNLLYGPDQSVTAVLDWEMLSISPRELDLGWWLSVAWYYTEGIGIPAPPGFPDRDTLIARYEQLTGAAVHNMYFYEVFGALRLAILSHRAGNLMIAAGQLPPDTTMKLSNPPSHRLAHLLDLPIPTGQSMGFAGNR
jgi:aminoglycoside phosphotransferase (APT) family kinase protein